MVNIHTGVHYELTSDIEGRARLVRETADPVGRTPAQRTKIGDDFILDGDVLHVSPDMVVTGSKPEERLPQMRWKQSEQSLSWRSLKEYKEGDISAYPRQYHGDEKFGRGLARDPSERPYQKFLGDGTPECRELQYCDLHPGDDDE